MPDNVRAFERVVTRKQAEEAVRSLLLWVGENPDREGLSGTPGRVVRAYGEWFGGYALDPAAILAKTFEETEGYDEMVTLCGIGFTSHCEHHMCPIEGVAHVGYIPSERVVGISKLARVVDAYARRFQIQERMTVQIADAIEASLKPRGVAVVIRARHHCMSGRGVRQPGTVMVTSRLTGFFRDDPRSRSEFLSLCGERP